MALKVRAPKQNWGDFNAQLASVNIVERKIHEIIARFGVEDFSAGIEGILDYADAQARRKCRRTDRVTISTSLASRQSTGAPAAPLAGISRAATWPREGCPG